MAVNIRQIFPLKQAKANRLQMPRYLKLDGGRYLIAAALILCLLSLLTLGQTGRLATKGYTMAQMQSQRTQLLRERSQLQMQLTEAQSLGEVRKRAVLLGLRPSSSEQMRYLTLPGTTGALSVDSAAQTLVPASTEDATLPLNAEGGEASGQHQAESESLAPSLETDQSLQTLDGSQVEP